MGMFDYVEVEDGLLPDGKVMADFKDSFGGDHFQTKDLELAMNRYKIEDGHLFVKTWDLQPTGRWFVYDFEMAKLGEPIYVDAPEDGQEWSFVEAMAAAERQEPYNRPSREMEQVNERWEVVPYTGELRFYTTGPNYRETRQWFEYVATFEDGEFQTIVAQHRKIGEG